MQEFVYVQNLQGNPIMPTTRHGWVRRVLRDDRAKVIFVKPFTIRLTYEPKSKEIQKTSLGGDPAGRGYIGLAVVRSDGTCLYSAQVKTRNKDVPRRIQERKDHCHQSRQGERENCKRLAMKHNTVMDCEERDRFLPQCDEPIHIKVITKFVAHNKGLTYV